MLHYSDLTTKQKEMIGNGCGAKGFLIKIPNFLFLASCNQHDFYYWRGGLEDDRKYADDKFYELMKQDAGWNVFYQSWAFIYWFFVRRFGRIFFSYGDMKDITDLKNYLDELSTVFNEDIHQNISLNL